MNIFTAHWVSVLWNAMTATGRGYKRQSLRHSGRGEDRRLDKIECAKAGIPQRMRRYRYRYGA